MANVKDHLRRDAEHAARTEIALLLAQYSRRVIDDAYTEISKRINSIKPGENVNGLPIGREAATEAFNTWLPLPNGEPQAALEEGNSDKSDTSENLSDGHGDSLIGISF